jgi:hypothetical protein
VLNSDRNVPSSMNPSVYKVDTDINKVKTTVIMLTEEIVENFVKCPNVSRVIGVDFNVFF